MTKQVRGQVAARVRGRRRRRSAAGITVLLVLAGGAGWQLWGPDAAVARSTATGGSPTDAPGAEPETITRLDEELARRFAEAHVAADADGVDLTLTSGWRSAAEQQVLVDKAIGRYGSPSEAQRWVLPPETSEHVEGLAIDVGPTEGALWLGDHAGEFGLCRTYANERWHFELLAEGTATCPDPHADASWGW